jgi:hypothetical protein
MRKQKIIKLLTYKDIEIIGSSSRKELDYPADIDLQEFVNSNETLDDIYIFFLNVFDEAYKNKDIYITDFKCGFLKGQPLRWNYEDMKNGYKIISKTKKILFTEAITHKSTIKLDTIVFLDNNILTEITNNYYFYFVKYKTKSYNEFINDDEMIKRKLLYGFRLSLEEGKFFKALKRLYSYYNILDNKEQIKKLVELFNSSLGKLYKFKSNLETIELLLTQEFREPLKNQIVTNLKIIRDELPNKYKKDITQIINISLDQMVNKIAALINDINEDINDETKKWIDKNNFNIII